MGLYKLIFAKGYSISLKWGFANGPGNAANHMHALMTLIIGINILTFIAVSLLPVFGKTTVVNFLTSGIAWVIILALVYWYVYIYFLYKQEYISIVKNFYNHSKFRGRNGTVIAILFCIGSALFPFALIFSLSWDKF